MWFARIKRFYDMGLWTVEQVREAVQFNRITQNEFKEITGIAY